MTIKKAFLVTFCLFIMFFTKNPLSYANADSQFNIDIRAGYDKTSKYGYTFPVFVTVENKGDDFIGELELSITHDKWNGVYSTPVDISSNSTKEYYFNTEMYPEHFVIQASLIRKGKEIQREISYENNNLVYYYQSAVGVISENKGSFINLNPIYLNQVKMSELTNLNLFYEITDRLQPESRNKETTYGYYTRNNKLETVFIDPKYIPEEAEGLGMFNFIIISNFDTSQLNDRQINALKDWVEAGNNLILCTGSNWKKVYSGLPDELKQFEISGVESKPSLTTVGTYFGVITPQNDAKTALGNLENGKKLIAGNGYPIAVTHNLKKGGVVYLAIDLSESPFSNWKHANTILEFVMNNAMENNLSVENDNLHKAYTFLGKIKYHIYNIHETADFPFEILMFVLFIYLVFAGPGLYYILRKYDKREYAWLGIPTIAIAIMLIIYGVGFKTRYTGAVVNAVTFTNVNSQNQTAEIYSCMAAFNNEQNQISFEYDKDINLSYNISNVDFASIDNPFMDYNYNFKKNFKHSISDKNYCELYNVNLWESAPLMATETIDFNAENIFKEISINEKTIYVKIRNTTDFIFEDSFICFGEKYFDTGDIRPGQEKTFELDLDLDGKNIRFFLSSRYEYGNMSQLNYGRYDKELKNDLKIRQMITSITTNDNPKTKNMLLDFYCFCDDYYPEIIVNGKKPIVYNTGIVKFSSKF